MSKQEIKTLWELHGQKLEVEINFREFESGKMKGYVNVVVKKGDEIFLIANDMQIVEGVKGKFISEPKKFNAEKKEYFTTYAIPRDLKAIVLKEIYK